MKVIVIFFTAFSTMFAASISQAGEQVEIKLETGSVYAQDGSSEGISIYGEEVWPFIDGEDYPYPDAVIWNVHDEDVPYVVKKCMMDSSIELREWITNPNDPIYKALKWAQKYGVTTSFFLWTNDYTQGQQWMQSNYRKAQSWNWKNSYLKWESTVDYSSTSENKCNNPRKKQTFNMILNESRNKAQNDNVDYDESGEPRWDANPTEAGDDVLVFQ